MNYGNIINGAWQITKSNKAMWFIGMLVVMGGTNIGQGFGNGFGQLFSLADSDNTGTTDLERWLNAYWWVVAITVIVLLLLALMAWLLNYIGTAGLITGANQARLEHKPRFGWMFLTGLRQGWKVFAIDLLLGLITTGLVLAACLWLGFMICSIVGIIAVPFMILALMVAILPLSAVMLAVRFYSLQYAILYQEPIMISLKKSWNLVTTNLMESAALFGMTLLLRVVMLLGIVLVFLLVSLPFAILGIVVYYSVGWFAVGVIIVLAGIILGCLALFIRGLHNTYIYSLWHLGFTELTLSRSSSAVEQ